MPRQKSDVLAEGRALRYSAAAAAQYRRKLDVLIRDMQREVKRGLLELFRGSDSVALDAADVAQRQARELAPAVAMDADIAGLAQTLLDDIHRRFTVLFAMAASEITGRLIDMTISRSNLDLGKSLKDIGDDQLTLTMGEKTRALVEAASLESTSLIKRVPETYLPKVQGDVMRSITTGRGLEDLIPQLEKRNVQVKNWAKNVALDQTRKVYATVNRARMEESGVKKFKWVHSGGSNDPRDHHLKRWPAGLNGGIFSFDDPPVIDPRTGERGFPGQLPYCGCTMSPVITLDDIPD